MTEHEQYEAWLRYWMLDYLIPVPREDTGMPHVIPTAAEYARMNHRQRRKYDKWVQQQEHLSQRYTLPPRYLPGRDSDAMTNEWARWVRAEARRLLAETPPDPDAEQHRITLLEAID